MAWRALRRDRVDGVIVISLPLRAAEVRALHREGVPAVLIDVSHALLPNVAIDDARFGRPDPKTAGNVEGRKAK